MCEHTVIPTIVNAAHPKNKPARPTVNLQFSVQECEECIPKKGKAKALEPGEEDTIFQAAAALKKVVVYEDEDKKEEEYDEEDAEEYEKYMTQRKILKAIGSKKGKGKKD